MKNSYNAPSRRDAPIAEKLWARTAEELKSSGMVPGAMVFQPDGFTAMLVAVHVWLPKSSHFGTPFDSTIILMSETFKLTIVPTHGLMTGFWQLV